MPDLDPAHVEAVARAWGNTFPDGTLGHLFALDRARTFLTSTDPDVHAALLAALVRAGVLEEDLSGISVASVVVVPKQRRYVTRWEDVDAD